MRDVPYDAWAAFTAAQLPAGPVLDLFCGNGAFTAALNNLGHLTIGLDASLSMLLKGCGLRVKADALSLPVKDAIAAAVTATNCSVNYLQSLNDLRIFFSECRRVLQPGGTLVFDYCPETRAWALSTRLFSALQGQVTFRHNYAPETASLVSTVTIHRRTETSPPSLPAPAMVRQDSPQVEIHSQRIFSQAEIAAKLENTGFNRCDFIENYGLPVPAGIAPVMTVVARLT